jgi:hypothetical protein
MYQILGIRNLLSGYSFLAAAIAVALSGFAHPATFRDWIGIVSMGASAAAVVFGVLGQTQLFPRICRWPVVCNFLPDIDGTWVGEVNSNWPRVRQRLSGEGVFLEEVPLQKVPVSVHIKARLLTVTMKLESEGSYSRSETLGVQLSRDPVSGSDRLVYVFKNDTRMAKPTDDSSHLGAGSLDVVRVGKRIELQGSYWTNRAWPKGLNTAGAISLRRPHRQSNR